MKNAKQILPPKKLQAPVIPNSAMRFSSAMLKNCDVTVDVIGYHDPPVWWNHPDCLQEILLCGHQEGKIEYSVISPHLPAKSHQGVRIRLDLIPNKGAVRYLYDVGTDTEPSKGEFFQDVIIRAKLLQQPNKLSSDIHVPEH
jgi:hypothetical protein